MVHPLYHIELDNTGWVIDLGASLPLPLCLFANSKTSDSSVIYNFFPVITKKVFLLAKIIYDSPCISKARTSGPSSVL
jgi:hypothetical protein